MPPGSRERVTPSGPIEEARWLRTKSPRWSAGKARLPSDRQAGAFARGAQYKTCADPALRPPRGQQEKPGESPEPGQSGLTIRGQHAARSRTRAPNSIANQERDEAK